MCLSCCPVDVLGVSCYTNKGTRDHTRTTMGSQASRCTPSKKMVHRASKDTRKHTKTEHPAVSVSRDTTGTVCCALDALAAAAKSIPSGTETTCQMRQNAPKHNPGPPVMPAAPDARGGAEPQALLDRGPSAVEFRTPARLHRFFSFFPECAHGTLPDRPRRRPSDTPARAS